MEELREIIKKCTRCRLHVGRKSAVPGEGPLSAKIVLVGEAPGRREDEEGRPFVGAAGRVLNSLLERAGLRREELFVTNVVRCRPPNNRRPRDDEVTPCMPYLLAEIAALRPAVVVAMGGTAGKALSRLLSMDWKGVGEMRGKLVRGQLEGLHLALVFTYHPSAALRRGGLRELIAEDLELAAEVGGRSPPGDPEDEPHSNDHSQDKGSSNEH